MINPPRNTSESVLIGILSLYMGSRGAADRLLIKVVERIDSEKSLNLLTSDEIWNSFRNNWSRSHIETLSSSLQSPFALIEADTSRRNILEFDVEDAVETDDQDYTTLKATARMKEKYEQYEPSFWLPVIAYCLEKATHQSELMSLINNFAFGYVLVCLSSTRESVRRMAVNILLKWDHLSEVIYLAGNPD